MNFKGLSKKEGLLVSLDSISEVTKQVISDSIIKILVRIKILFYVFVW